MTLLVDRTAAPAAPEGRHQNGKARRGAADLRGVVAVLAVIGAFHVCVALRQNPSASLLALAFLVTVPGLLLMRALRLPTSRPAEGFVLAVVSSIAVDLVVVLLVNWLGPLRGVHHPLGTRPVLVGLDAAMALLVVTAVIRRAPLNLPLPSRLPLAALFLLPPLATAAGTQLLENRNDNLLVIVGLGAASVVLLGAAGYMWRTGAEGPALVAVFAMSLALMWSYSLRSKGLYGFDVQLEFGAFRDTNAALHWVPVPGQPYAAMLSITALPTALSQLTGFSGLGVYKVLFPVLFAVYPVGVFVIARRWLRPGTALLGTCVLLWTGSFGSEMPALARQEIGLLMFVGIVMAMFGRGTPRRGGQILVVVLGVAMTVSHYSTTYVAVAAFVGARLVALVLRSRRAPEDRKPVLSALVVAVLVGFCALWNVGITKSANNVTSFASSVGHEGVNVLPNGQGSALTRWLAGGVTENVAPATYFHRVGVDYATRYLWLQPFAADVQSSFPAVASQPRPEPAVVHGLAAPRMIVTTLLRQLATFGTAIGAVWMFVLAWRRRVRVEIAALVVSFALLTAVLRVSGAASFAYNPERMALQADAVLLVALGIVVEGIGRRLSGRRGTRDAPRGVVARRIGAAAGAASLVLIAADATGIGTRLEGGVPQGNLSRSGEYAERFEVTSQDLVAAHWLGVHRRADSTVFGDRYAALSLKAYSGVDQSGIFGDLTPQTLDQRSFVFTSTANLLDGRARGITPDNGASSTYVYPISFLNSFKAVVFDTGWTRIYF